MFGNKEKKEMEKRLLVKRTIASMNKQIEKLEQQKKFFLDKAVEARKKGLDSQLVTAMNGYKTTAMHLKRTQEMLLNFELTSQMKDMTMMTSEFLRSMGSLSKEMGKLADDKEFVKHHLKILLMRVGQQVMLLKIDFGYLRRNSYRQLQPLIFVIKKRCTICT